MRANGYFVTQQVTSQNTLNILNAFGWTSASFGDDWWQSAEQRAAEFELIGCRIIEKAEYNVRNWFSDVESLVFWLKSVPLPEPFDVEKHWEGVNRILKEYSTPRGLGTNEHRELLIVQKVEGLHRASLTNQVKQFHMFLKFRRLMRSNNHILPEPPLDGGGWKPFHPRLDQQVRPPIVQRHNCRLFDQDAIRLAV